MAGSSSCELVSSTYGHSDVSKRCHIFRLLFIYLAKYRYYFSFFYFILLDGDGWRRMGNGILLTYYLRTQYQI